MNFELTLLETLTREKKTKAGYAELKDILLKEKDRIISSMESAIIASSPTEIKKYIQQHQLALLRLNDESADHPDERIGFLLAETTKELLFFIEKQFGNWIFYDAVLPPRSCIHCATELSNQLDVIDHQLKESGVKNVFNNAINSAFNVVLKEAYEHRLTCRHGYQMKELFYGIRSLIELNAAMPERLPRQLLLEFCRVNLNTPDVFEVCKNTLIEEVEIKETISEQLIQFKKQRDLVKQVTPINGYYFSSTARHLWRSLHDWLLDEIHKLENRQHIISEEFASEEVIKDSEKIMTSLSRAELALLVLLFFRTGVFINKYKASVARFMAMFVRTRNKSREDPQSAGKLYDDMKGIKISTVNSVDNILERLKKQNNKIRVEILNKQKARSNKN